MTKQTNIPNVFFFNFEIAAIELEMANKVSETTAFGLVKHKLLKPYSIFKILHDSEEEKEIRGRLLDDQINTLCRSVAQSKVFPSH